jgi:hypothetical protein
LRLVDEDFTRDVEFTEERRDANHQQVGFYSNKQSLARVECRI